MGAGVSVIFFSRTMLVLLVIHAQTKVWASDFVCVSLCVLWALTMQELDSVVCACVRACMNKLVLLFGGHPEIAFCQRIPHSMISIVSLLSFSRRFEMVRLIRSLLN